MAKLSARQLKAIENLLKGMSKYEALKEAGYTEKTAASKCTEIFDRPDMASEVKRRQSLSAARTDITLDKLNKILLEIAEASPGEMLSTDAAGNVFVDWSLLTPAMKKVIGGFTVDEMTEGRGEDQQKFKRIKLQFVDRLRAIEQLVRFNGLSKEKVHLEVEGDFVEQLHRGRNRVAVKDEE